MARQYTMNISLTPQLHEYVKEKLAEGGYQSGSEVVRESLRLLSQRDRHSLPKEAAREKIASGLAQAKRGELRDGESVFAEQRDRLVKKLRRRASKHSRS
jgi:antitoxin ParD1/3/4